MLLRSIYQYKLTLSFIAGCFLTLCYAPFNILPFAFLSFYLLLDLAYHENDTKDYFKIFFAFGFGHFLSSLYWISIALTFELSKFWWLIPISLIFIPSIMALYLVIVGLITLRLRHNKILYSIMFSCTWVMIEYVRSYVPFHFAWNNIAYTIAEFDYPLQISHFLGLHLTSLFMMIIYTSVFSKNLRYICVIIIIFIISSILGYMKISKNPQQFDQEGTVRIVQPSIKEHHMGRSHVKREILNSLVELSLQGLPTSNKAIIWSEAALPYVIFNDSKIPQHLAKILTPQNILITGADRTENGEKVYNSIIAIDHFGNILKTYDKEILVPFGEYIPIRNFLPFLENITNGFMDFSKGVNFDIHTDDLYLNFYPLICYEALYPLKDNYTQNAWMLNITNDAWFGNSTGPYQHFAMTKFKAAEYGMPLIRVANNGISAVISMHGQVLEKIPLNEQAAIDVSIPSSHTHKWHISDFNSFVVILLIFFICAFLQRKLI
ncbi:MAG: apolipoprotein N-acyltransferase [Alphaproteobacteria bacterium]|nr:apolipoprotein N-acyltransferase [Candidatus Jidaibacter sp.]